MKTLDTQQEKTACNGGHWARRRELRQGGGVPGKAFRIACTMVWLGELGQAAQGGDVEDAVPGPGLGRGNGHGRSGRRCLHQVVALARCVSPERR